MKELEVVFVHLGCYLKKNAPNWVVHIKILISHSFWKLEIQEHGASRFRIWGELSSGFIGGPFLAEYSHGTAGEGALWSLFYKDSNHLPKAPPPHIVTLGFRISRYEFWEDKNIQTRAEGEKERDFSGIH